MAGQISSSSSPKITGQGWPTHRQEPESTQATRIIAEIDRAISETCVRRNGPLEMTPSGGWTYQMPWHQFPGGKLDSPSPLCISCHALFKCADNSRRTYAYEGCTWATRPDAEDISYIREGAVEKKSECHFCRLTFNAFSQDELITLQGGFDAKIGGEPESSLLRLTWTYSPRLGTAPSPSRFSKSVMLVSKSKPSGFALTPVSRRGLSRAQIVGLFLLLVLS